MFLQLQNLQCILQKKKKKGFCNKSELHKKTEEIYSNKQLCSSPLCKVSKFPVGLENGCYGTKIHIICTKQNNYVDIIRSGLFAIKTAGNVWGQTKEMSKKQE